MLLLILIAGLLGGFLIGRSTSPAPVTAASAAPKKPAVWTCSMHPQIRLPGPGTCPICSMPLTPADASDAGGGSPAVVLSEAARAMAEVETAPVQRRRVTREIRAVGKVQYNETALSTVTSRVSGYIERLFVDYVGIEVQKGDHLVEIYSPDLVVAQNELLVASAGGNQSMVDAARIRLRRAGITDEQVEEVIRTRKPRERLTIFSPVKGTVVEKLVVEMSAVKDGDVLYRLVNLDSVWVNLDIYEYEVPWVLTGHTVEIRTEAYPGSVFTGRVTFISPLVTEETRTIKVRVNVANGERKLKPGMLVSAAIRVPLRADGMAAPTGVEGLYTCPMHPEIAEEKPGSCSVCGMALEKQPAREKKSTAAPSYQCPMHPEVTSDKPSNCPKCGMKLDRLPAPSDDVALAVPVLAVLDSGDRKMVYVEDGPGRYRPAVVVVGPRSGDVYPVISGLTGTERVVVRGNFLIDSEAQIRELPSLLRNESAHAPTPPPPSPTSPPSPASTATSAEPAAGSHSDHAGSHAGSRSDHAAPTDSTTPSRR
jgi:membrane fusion protein, copper/silver efflux system